MEENIEEIFRYSKQLGMELSEENLIYHEGFTAISVKTNAQNWVMHHDGEVYVLLHISENTNYKKKVRYHRHRKSKSYHIIVKDMIQSHGVGYHKR